MKITIYNTKWGVWKTPIATNIALDREYAIWSNEPYPVFDGLIPEERLLMVDLGAPFPKIPDDSGIDIVFDLAGSISQHAHSITSAIQQSDLVIVPIYNEIKSLTAWLNTLIEVLEITTNVAVVATKLKRNGTADRFKKWRDTNDFKNIETAVHSNINPDIPVLPLKLSTVFDSIFEHEWSIRQLMKKSGLAAYQYREVAQQFDAIYSLIDQYNGQ